ncbi:MAG: SPASM domain-containing protein [archaeon]|nr:MAG: SPASM domain-containing protein [archaeon]
MAGGEGTSNFLGKYLVEPWFKLFPRFAVNNFVPMPSTFEIEVSNKCNKKCVICEHTYWKEPSRDVTFEEFKELVDQFPNLKWVNLTGEGDAFLNPDYIKMIAYLKKKHKLPIYLVESFDLLNKETSKKVIKLGVDGIWVSWDSSNKKTYEKIKRGCKWDRSLKNLKDLIELKKEMKSPIPELCFRFIVTKLNVHEMPDFIDFIAGLGDRESLGDGYRVEFAGLLCFKEVEHLYVDKIPDEIRNEVLKRAEKHGIRVAFAHSSKEELPPLHECRAWAEPYIMMGGYVMPCCAVLMSNKRDFLRKYAFGNIYETPFKKIWNSKRYRKFREMITLKNKKVPILCEGCRAYNTTVREKKYGVAEKI